MASEKAAQIRIGGRLLREDRPAYIIAEGGVNHQGDPRLAARLVKAARRAGADAIKFQAFDPELLVSSEAPTADYQRKRTRLRSQRAMLRKLALPASDFMSLAETARAVGIDFMLTPFDEENLRVALAARVKAIKWSSGELTNLPLLRKAVKTGKPILLSTGMSRLSEIDAAVAAIRASRNGKVVVLHCVTAYPAKPETSNLRALSLLRERYGLPVGFSDHTTGTWAAPIARALGAVVIEKHLTLDRRLPGPDQATSVEPDDFAELVVAVRRVETALGRREKKPLDVEREMVKLARRGVVAARAIPKGRKITRADLALRRPATGIQPGELDKAVGRVAKRAIGAGEPIRWSMLRPLA